MSLDKHWDKASKTIKLEFANTLFQAFNIDEEIIYLKDSDRTNLRAGEKRADLVGKSKYGYDVNVEFQKNKPNNKDFERFLDYAMEIYKDERKSVVSYIISLDDYDENCKTMYIGSYGEYKMVVLSLQKLKFKEELNNIKFKIENKQELSYEDVTYLKVGFLTNCEGKEYETIMDVANLTNKIKTLSIDEFNQIKLFHLSLGGVILDEKQYEKLVGVVVMGFDVLESIVNFGEKKGRMEGKWEMIDNIIDQGGDLAWVSSVSGLSIDEIMEHRNSK